VSLRILVPSIKRLRLATLALALLLAAAAPSHASDTYRIIHTYPHDRQAFTQGLIYTGGHLYKSTGLEGHSSLRMEDLETGSILQYKDVSSQYFAEGLTQWGNTLIQLTWQNHIALVYDLATFRFLRAIPYSGDGWGLTQDGKNLILSDGSATLHFLDPETFHELRHITVQDRGVPVTQLNELEFVHGQIYANIWYADRVVRIDPATGHVLGFIDLTGLLPENEHSSSGAVLNGIAWDAEHDRLFVTGKLWPKLFEIEIIPQQTKIPNGKPKK
jgi:glutamine cyclotransferase